MVNGTLIRRILILNLIVCIQICFIHEILDGPYQPVTISMSRKVFRNCCSIIWKLWTPIIVGLPDFITDQSLRAKVGNNLWTLLMTTAAMQTFLRLMIWALVDSWDYLVSSPIVAISNSKSNTSRDSHDSSSTTSLSVIHTDFSAESWDTSWVILFVVLHLCRMVTNWLFQCYFTLREAVVRDVQISHPRPRLLLHPKDDDDDDDDDEDDDDEDDDDDDDGNEDEDIEGDEDPCSSSEGDVDIDSSPFEDDDSSGSEESGSDFDLSLGYNFDNDSDASYSDSENEIDEDLYLPVLVDYNNNHDLIEMLRMHELLNS